MQELRLGQVTFACYFCHQPVLHVLVINTLLQQLYVTHFGNTVAGQINPYATSRSLVAALHTRLPALEPIW